MNVADLLLPRNRTRKAAKRAAQLAALVDDEDDWANNFRAHHLGEKLISLALRFAVFEGKPIFEAKEDREGCRIRPKPETSIFSRSSRRPTFSPDKRAAASYPQTDALLL